MSRFVRVLALLSLLVVASTVLAQSRFNEKNGGTED